ncbi:MAG TPA: hypothetical protein VFO19_14455, partial [Vicinamibacterales bacterium]|nr:hypothetical protein [Vicinamibacterales bacterium]
SRLAPVMGQVIAADVAREIVAPPGHAASRRLTREAAEALATARTQQSRGELEASLLSYESAASLAPHSPAAWTGLGEALLRGVRAGWVDSGQGLARAQDASRRALALEPEFPDAIELDAHLTRVRTSR